MEGNTLHASSFYSLSTVYLVRILCSFQLLEKDAFRLREIWGNNLPLDLLESLLRSGVYLPENIEQLCNLK